MCSVYKYNTFVFNRHLQFSKNTDYPRSVWDEIKIMGRQKEERYHFDFSYFNLWVTSNYKSADDQ